jgi:surface antigen
VWTSSAVEAQITIKPIAKFTRGDGKTCRTFVQTWLHSAGRRRYPGTACRNASGTWLIPGLDGDNGVADFATGDLS